MHVMAMVLAMRGFKSHRHRQPEGPASLRKHWEVGAFVMSGGGLR